MKHLLEDLLGAISIFIICGGLFILLPLLGG
jgi:hypothetical protein